MPIRSVSLDQGIRGRWPPGSCCVSLRAHLARCPAIAYRINPFPLRLDLVPAHKQGGISLDEVQKQPLVGDASSHADKGIDERQVEWDFAQTNAIAIEARLLGHHQQANILLGL